MVGEIGLSPSTTWTRVLGVESHWECIDLEVQIKELTQTLRRDARGAYHLFGGGVTNKTQAMAQSHFDSQYITKWGNLVVTRSRW